MDKAEILATPYALLRLVNEWNNEEVCNIAYQLIEPGGRLYEDMVKKGYVQDATGKSHPTALYRIQENGFNPKRKDHVKMARRICKAYAEITLQIVQRMISPRSVYNPVAATQESS